MKDTNLIAVSTPDGDHELVLRNMTFPKSRRRQFEPATAPQRQPGGSYRSGFTSAYCRIVLPFLRNNSSQLRVIAPAIVCDFRYSSGVFPQ